jgi:hypothetical protein
MTEKPRIGLPEPKPLEPVVVGIDSARTSEVRHD